MMMVEEEYIEEFEENEDAASASLRFSKKSELAVFPRDFRKAYHLAFSQIPSLKIAPIVGMAGIGKTTLAREIFHHPNITSFFECLAWVKVGENCPPEQIRRSILQQIPDSSEEGDERYLRELLKARRYLIVLDDVWELELWRELRNLFDYKRDHSAVILTTRLQDVALGASDQVIQMSLLDKEESWTLLRTTVFGNDLCPYELEKAGVRIAEKCDGLPLMIVTIAKILLESATKIAKHRYSVFLDANDGKILEYLTKIAEDDEHRNSVFKDAYDLIYTELNRSYCHLFSNPVMVPCFLYMGAFPNKYEIPTSKLIKLWSAEGFLHPSASKTSAELTLEYLEWLHSTSLVLTVQESSNGGIKTWRLHSVFWYLCNVEASKEQVFKGLNSIQDLNGEEIDRHRRFSINTSALFTIREIHEVIASIPNVQSLLCFGPYHQYQVRLYFNSMFLKVIDVLSIRFYHFPMEVVELQHLRNLTLTCSGNLPAAISKLKFLEFLIIRRHLSIKYSGISRDLPIEVWEMKSLKHLQVTGSNLPHPNCDSVLPNLLTLLDVGAQTCSTFILERIPNLEKLGVQFDTAPPAGAEPPSWSSFDYPISHLKNLRSLKCVNVNPVLIQQDSMPPRLPILPLGLKKLSLSGFGYPWEEMSKIASLPNLEVLKLQCFAFQGPEWQVRDLEFPALKYLLVEDTDLLHWTAASSSFYSIQHIIIKNCYRLQDIPLKFWNNVPADLFDCNPLAAKVKVRHHIPSPHLKVHAEYSWKSSRVF